VTKTSGKESTRPAGENDRSRRRQPLRDLRRLHGGATSHRAWFIVTAVIVMFAVAGLYVMYQNSHNKHSATAGGGFKHVEGQPGKRSTAPGFTLTSATGQQVSLSDFRGKNILLYFQEGLMCEPCWTQIKDLERNETALKTAGIDAVVSITTDPANLLHHKVGDEKLSTPVLSDPTMQVSRAYNANRYGMMGDMRDGHSFVLVGPNGTIEWRADYGGAPDYTMFLPTQQMLVDLDREKTP
jgi:peroxiredoxin Q/BCP